VIVINSFKQSVVEYLLQGHLQGRVHTVFVHEEN